MAIAQAALCLHIVCDCCCCS